MGFNRIKIGSKVIVTASLREHDGYVSNLDALIGKICVVKSINHLQGECHVESEHHGNWWFPLACIIHIDDRRGVPIGKNRVGLRVKVFNLGLMQLSIHGSLTRSRCRALCGKPATIVSNIKETTFDDRRRNAYFIDVEIDSNVYELPLCSLRMLEPEYKSREINYAV